MANIDDDDFEEIAEALSDIAFYLRRIDQRLEALPHDIAHKMGHQSKPFSASKSEKQEEKA